MSASDLADYYQEVYNFLQSVTIKFTPLIDAMNQYVINKGLPVDETTPATWKYYLNATGAYHPADTPMLVMSLDTQEQILFSPAVLVQHPKTAAAYVPGQSLYNGLCSKYPDQVDLIKSIVYPVSDINLAINADDFCILAYGTAILEPDEYDTVLRTITQFLDYINRRWYFDFFNYEPYYPWIFWGQLWQNLIQIILLARIEAIKTSNVHSWHLWEYLKSYGLKDYRDVLTRKQALFLYRNMPYLIANRGKQTNLVILADHLLSDLGVGLYGLDIWQTTLFGAATAQLTPELVPIGIPTKFINALPAESAETVSQLEQRLYVMGTEVDISSDRLAAMTQQLATTPLNTLPTKLLELRQLATDFKFAGFLNRFLLDSLVYAVANNLYTGTIAFTETTTETSVSLTVAEALVLYSYCAFKAIGQTPVNIPTHYNVRVAFAKTSVVPTTVMFDGDTYPMTNFTNVANYLGQYTWPSTPSQTPAEFTTLLSRQFLAAINQIQISRLEEDTRAAHALHVLTDAVIARETVTVSLDPQTTYAQWFTKQPAALTNMFSIFDAQADPIPLYDGLANIILSNLLPATPTFALYGNFALTGTAYAKFKELFVQLCSYDVLFLDSDTTVQTGIFMGKTTSYPKTRTITRSYEIPTDANLLIKHVFGDTYRVPPTVLTITANTDLTVEHEIQTSPTLAASSTLETHHRITAGSTACPQTPVVSNNIVFNYLNYRNDSLVTVS